MKILIPEHIQQNEIEEIKNNFPSVVIVRLKIVIKKNIVYKIFRKMGSCVLPYKIYKKLETNFNFKTRYSLFVDGQPLNTPQEDIDVLLASWAVNRGAFDLLKNYLPNLKWIHSMKTGIDHLDSDFVKKSNIILTNARGIHSKRIAEFALACMFEVSKKISYHIELKRKKKWDEIGSVEMEGKTVGIFGTGSLGSAIAQKCNALGMKTVGCDRTMNISDHFIKIVKLDQMGEIIKEADFIILCLPLTSNTAGLIGAKELSLMKKSAYIMNFGRSGLIDKGALVEALKKKTIKGAVLDVYRQDMKLPNHPFYKLDNVILTHYSAHASKTSNRELFELFLENFRNYIDGKALMNVVTL